MHKSAAAICLVSTMVCGCSGGAVRTWTLPEDNQDSAERPDCLEATELADLSGAIVYEGDPVTGVDDGLRFEVWSVASPDWQPRLLAGGSAFDGHPAWSPDGSQVVYSANDGEDADLWLIDMDTLEQTTLISTESWEDYPVWVDAGVIFTDGEGRSLIDPSTLEVTPLDFPDTLEALDASPDQSQWVFSLRQAPEAYHLHLAD